MASDRHYFPAWRVFVFGEEVTEDVLSCTVTYNDGRAPNTCEVELVSAGTSTGDEGDANRLSADHDRYILSEHDIAAIFEDVVLDDIILPDDKQILKDLSDVDDLLFGTPKPVGFEDAQAQLVAESQRVAQATLATRVAARADELEQVIRSRVEDVVRDPVKRRVLDRKFDASSRFSEMDQPPVEQTGTATVNNVRQLAALKGEAMRYPMQVGDCIFHSNDPIRVFWRDPSNPGVWYHMFAGFVTDWVDRVSENNDRTLTLRAEDPTRILRYARLTTNPGIFDIRARQRAQDAVIRTFFNSGFANLSMIEFMYTIIFGSTLAGTTEQLGSGGDALASVNTFTNTRVSVFGSESYEVNAEGAGAFNFERSLTLLLPIPGSQDEDVSANLKNKVIKLSAAPTELAQYQAIVDHRVSESDIDNMIVQGRESVADTIKSGLTRDTNGNALASLESRAQMRGTADIIGAIGSQPELFPVDGGRLIILAPQSLGAAIGRNILLKDIGTVDTNTTWRSRLSLVYDLMERIEFSFSASPRGDLLCEMPLYDFEPDDFSDAPVSLLGVSNRLGAIESRTRDGAAKAKRLVALEGEQHGPFAPSMRVPKQDTISWERSFSDEQVRTQMICWESPFQAYNSNLPGTVKTLGQLPNVSFLQALVPQFGVRSEQVDPKGLIATPQAAKLYATLKLNQLNADARSAHIQALPRFSLAFPNRPIEFVERKFIGTIRSITHAIRWNSDISTTYNVNYIRGWGGQRHPDGRVVYEPLGGAASQPLNYAVLFNSRRYATSTKKVGQ